MLRQVRPPAAGQARPTVPIRAASPGRGRAGEGRGERVCRELVTSGTPTAASVPPQQGLDRNMLGTLAGANSLRNFTSRF